MEPQQSTPHENQRNVIQIDKAIAKDKSEYTIEYEMSDLAFQQFQGFNETILGINIEEMQLLSKQLDKPLSMWSKIGASVLGLKTRHQFLLFTTKRFLMSIDFYQGNRIRIRVGDQMKVFQTQSSNQRRHSQIVKTEQGLQWRRHFKQGELTVNDVIGCLKHKEIERAHSKISFNGAHFSRKLWGDLCEVAQGRK